MERNLPSSKREQEDLTSSNQCDYSRTWYRSILSVLTRQSSNVSNRCGVGNPKPWVYSIVPFCSMGDSSETQEPPKGLQCYGGTKRSHSLGAGPSDLVLAGKRAGEHDSCESHDSIGFTMS